MSSSGALTPRVLCGCPHRPSSLFHLPKLRLCPHETLTPSPSPALGTHHLLPVSESHSSRSSYQWGHTVCVLCDWLISSAVSSGSIHAAAGDRIPSFLRLSNVHRVAGPHLSVTHPSVDTGLLPPPSDCAQCCRGRGVQGSLRPRFLFFWAQTQRWDRRVTWWLCLII